MTGLGGEGRALTKVMNVEQIVREAENVEYNPLIPFKYWLRSAGTILKEAQIYEREGNDQQTYFLLYRHAQLVLNFLSKNQESKTAQNRPIVAEEKKSVAANIKKLEILKPRINKRYERYEELMRERDARRAATAAAPQNSRNTTPTGQKRDSSDLAADETETLAAGENRDLAVHIARKELKRRALARKSTRQAGIPEEVEHERRTAGVWGDWEEALTKNNRSLDKDALSKQMQNVRSQVNGTGSEEIRRRDSKVLIDGIRSKYSYPVVPDRTQRDSRIIDIPRRTSSSIQPAQRPPEPPPKDPETFFFDEDTPTPPERPQKELSHPNGHIANQSSEQRSSLDAKGYTFQIAARLENGSPLRTVFLPPKLRHQFLSIAETNTRANRETCGILCGTLISNALFISKLVIPEQESTSDTCEMVNESALFDYVDGEDLMVLGWIHTHPTQTCFMSSRDLHTHGGYQVMMPESIAIVCAPSKNEWGVFRLTDPPGMKTVLNCTQTGLFHPHSEQNVYTDALRPGHVFETRDLDFDVVDLRP